MNHVLGKKCVTFVHKRNSEICAFLGISGKPPILMIVLSECGENPFLEVYPGNRKRHLKLRKIKHWQAMQKGGFLLSG